MYLQQKDILGKLWRPHSKLRMCICHSDTEQVKTNSSACHQSRVVNWSVELKDRIIGGRINVQILMERRSSLRALKSREDYPFLELWDATQTFTAQLKIDRAETRLHCTAYLDDLVDISQVSFQFIYLWKNRGKITKSRTGTPSLPTKILPRVHSFVDTERITTLPLLAARSLLWILQPSNVLLRNNHKAYLSK